MSKFIHAPGCTCRPEAEYLDCDYCPPCAAKKTSEVRARLTPQQRAYDDWIASRYAQAFEEEDS